MLVPEMVREAIAQPGAPLLDRRLRSEELDVVVEVERRAVCVAERWLVSDEGVDRSCRLLSDVVAGANDVARLASREVQAGPRGSICVVLMPDPTGLRQHEERGDFDSEQIAVAGVRAHDHLPPRSGRLHRAQTAVTRRGRR